MEKKERTKKRLKVLVDLEKTIRQKINDKSKGNAIMVDTNVLINDPNSISELIRGNNLVIIPKTVIFELDKLKRRDETKLEARIAIKLIYGLQKDKSNNLLILWEQDFSNLKLDKTVPDHQIIAAFNYVVKNIEFSGYKKFKLISDDTGVLLIAGKLFVGNDKVEIEPYRHIRVKVKTPQKDLKPIFLKSSDYSGSCIIYQSKRFPGIKENGGILLQDSNHCFMALRKGKQLIPINGDISVCGIKAMNGGSENWRQEQFIAQLLDPSIEVVMVSGPAGTGKTLLTLAAALEQRKKYREIIITRPAIPLDDKDNLGFLPGDLNTKMYEYMVPIIQDLEVIIEANAKNSNFFMKKKSDPLADPSYIKKSDSKKGKKKKNEKEKITNVLTGDLLLELRKDSFSFLNNLGIKVNSLQHYRGRTYHNTFVIIDEAQNLSPAEIKTILTRMGHNSKIVLTGDLDQIDKRFLNKENSGLAYAMVKLEGNPMIGATSLTYSVRSKIAAYAEKML